MKKHVVVMLALLCATGLFALVSMAQDPAPKPAGPVAAAPVAPPAPQVPPQPAGEKIKGTLVNQGGPLSQYFMAGYCQIDIKEYTSDKDLMDCYQALKTGGQDALLKKLWKMKEVGYIKVSGSLGYPLVIARSRPTPDGRVVRILTNRPMVPMEFGGRSGDYPFGFIEIFLPKDGKGHGTLIPMAEVQFTEKGGLAVESYGTMPFRLLDMGAEAPKEKKK